MQKFRAIGCAVFLALCALCLSACRQTQAETAFLVQETPQTTETTSVISDLDDETVQQLQTVFEQYNTVGAQAAYIRDGKVKAVYAFGEAQSGTPVTRETKFRVASLSKLTTDMVFMHLEEMRLVSQTADVGDYMGFPVRNAAHPDDRITPRMLMSHTSTIVDSSAFQQSRRGKSAVPIRELLEDRNSFTRYTPGQSYTYSNFALAVVGSICERVSGKSFGVLAQEFLFEPMNLDAAYTASALRQTALVSDLVEGGDVLTAQDQLQTAFHPQIGQTHHIVQGNLTISAEDYAQLLCMLLHDGTYQGKQILQSESVRAILDSYYVNGNNRIGYGLRRNDAVIPGEAYYVHTGDGYGMHSAFAFSADKQDGAVVLTSGANTRMDDATSLYDVCLDAIRILLQHREQKG